MFTYLASCGTGSCTSVNSNSLEWFKFDESGLINGTVYDGVWGHGIMLRTPPGRRRSLSHPLPSPCTPFPRSSTPSARRSTSAAAGASRPPPPSCASSRGATRIPAWGVRRLLRRWYYELWFCGAGAVLHIGGMYGNIAEETTSYPIPGPPLYAGATVSSPSQTASGSSSFVSAASESATSASTASTTTGTSTATSTMSSSTSTRDEGLPQYAQCGGMGWTGVTACLLLAVSPGASITGEKLKVFKGK